MGFPFLVQVGDTVTDIIIQNYEKTKKELLVDFNKESFFENWQENETWEVSFNVTKTDLNSTAFYLVDTKAR